MNPWMWRGLVLFLWRPRLLRGFDSLNESDEVDAWELCSRLLQLRALQILFWITAIMIVMAGGLAWARGREIIPNAGARSILILVTGPAAIAIIWMAVYVPKLEKLTQETQCLIASDPDKWMPHLWFIARFDMSLLEQTGFRRLYLPH